MKKITLSLAVALIAAAACQKPEATLPVADQFTASVESFDSPTRTSMNSDRQVVWSEGDRLAIFHGSTIAKQYQIAGASVGKTNGIFNRVVADDQSGDSFYAGTEMPCNVAFYPYAESLALVGKMLEERGAAYDIENVVLPAVQYYAENSFPDGAFPMVAVTESVEENVLQFKNLLGAMKLQLKGTQTVKSIKVTGNNNEKLSGAATVTAYANNLAPALTMTATDDASKSVTLDCGDGVQLNESAATDFIIVLPPVLFSQGFTVTVTDSNDETYTIDTDKANTVLRSSILVMPTIILGDEVTEDEEDDNGDNIEYPVEAVTLNKTSLTLAPGTSYSLVAKVVPTNATDKTLTWSSSAYTVATVDEPGVVTAVSDGTVTITAVAVGGASESCTVNVISLPSATATADYKDEYGVNHGKGIAIGGTVWAPVNCGYKAPTYDEDNNVTDKGFPYGKLYQWGRKYGQGYSEDYDSSVPTLEEGPVSMAYGQSESKSSCFFTSSSSPHDWASTPDDNLWNSGTDESPVRTENDPCPNGWRVPTYSELEALMTDYSDWTTVDGMRGRYFSGVSTTKYDTPPMGEGVKIFFPAAGFRYPDGDAYYRGTRGGGYYWSSDTNSTNAYYLLFGSGTVGMGSDPRAYGYSVRCVQVTD